MISRFLLKISADVLYLCALRFIVSKICQTVACIFVMGRFHEFFQNSNFWRVFDIRPNARARPAMSVDQSVRAKR